jgi:hypothetical protein
MRDDMALHQDGGQGKKRTLPTILLHYLIFPMEKEWWISASSLPLRPLQHQSAL